MIILIIELDNSNFIDIVDDKSNPVSKCNNHQHNFGQLPLLTQGLQLGAGYVQKLIEHASKNCVTMYFAFTWIIGNDLNRKQTYDLMKY